MSLVWREHLGTGAQGRLPGDAAASHTAAGRGPRRGAACASSRCCPWARETGARSEQGGPHSTSALALPLPTGKRPRAVTSPTSGSPQEPQDSPTESPRLASGSFLHAAGTLSCTMAAWGSGVQSTHTRGSGAPSARHEAGSGTRARSQGGRLLARDALTCALLKAGPWRLVGRAGRGRTGQLTDWEP